MSKSHLPLNLEGQGKAAGSDPFPITPIGGGGLKPRELELGLSSLCSGVPHTPPLLPQEPSGPMPCPKRGSQASHFCRRAVLHPPNLTVFTWGSLWEANSHKGKGRLRVRIREGRLRNSVWDFLLVSTVSPGDPRFSPPRPRPQWSPSRRGLRRPGCSGMTSRS